MEWMDLGKMLHKSLQLLARLYVMHMYTYIFFQERAYRLYQIFRRVHDHMWIFYLDAQELLSLGMISYLVKRRLGYTEKNSLTEVEKPSSLPLFYQCSQPSV